jgi:hypothetical protein
MEIVVFIGFLYVQIEMGEQCSMQDTVGSGWEKGCGGRLLARRGLMIRTGKVVKKRASWKALAGSPIDRKPSEDLGSGIHAIERRGPRSQVVVPGPCILIYRRTGFAETAGFRPGKCALQSLRGAAVFNIRSEHI